jgi:hypothetical protein
MNIITMPMKFSAYKLVGVKNLMTLSEEFAEFKE